MSRSAYFRLSERLQHGIASTLRWSELRPVQELTIEAVLAGKNAVVLAPTAGGKTEAAFFPILDLLHIAPEKSVGCIYVSPLRALLNNQEARLQELTRLVGISVFKWHGDVGSGPRKLFLSNPASVLMTTPESLEVMLMTGQAEKNHLFDQTRFVVIDEIHAFAADDRGAHLMALLERIQRTSNKDIQRIGLSATVGNPEELSAWMQGTSERERTVIDPPREKAARRVAVRYAAGEPEETAAAAVPIAHGKKSIFFTQGRAATEEVRQAFKSRDVDVFVHHSSVARDLREEAEDRFMRTETAATIVSTSTLELGIDVGDLDLVLQLDAPFTVSSFLQRMGRTGRRSGTTPHIEFFTSSPMNLLQSVALVNLASRKFIESVEPSSANLPVFLHQILAHIVGKVSVRRDVLWQSLQGPAPFRNIPRQDFDGIVDHLLAGGILEQVEHFLVLGEKGERIFGGMNFFDLYGVFETASEVVVKTRSGTKVGTLESMFVRRQKDESFTFLLAGRNWIAVEVDLQKNLVVAEPFGGTEAPKWHGAGGFLGREITEEMRNVLLSDQKFPFVDDLGREQIQRMRRESRTLLAKDRCPITFIGKSTRLYTYAGGRINATIAALVEDNSTCKVRDFGDLDITIEVAGTQSESYVREALLKIRDADKRLGREDLSRLVSEKNRARMSKFQPYLPPDLEGSYLAERLFDLRGAAELARNSEFATV